VTLIDFPQMVSTRHPNAKELYERDLKCLERFFVMKLKCVPEDGWTELMPVWEDVIKPVDEEIAVPDDASTCIASRAQIRLDEELKASGFSENDATRDMELYYYSNDPVKGLGMVDDEDIGEEEEDEQDSVQEEEEEDLPADLTDPATLGHSVPEIQDDRVVVEGLVDHTPPVRDLLDEDQMSVFTEQSRAMAEEKARYRVQQHLMQMKKKSGRNNAFKSRNSSKTFEKGKRVYQESLEF